MMGYGSYGGYGNGYGMMGGGWGGLIFMLFNLLVLVGIVLLVIWAVRAAAGGHHMGSVPPGAVGHNDAVSIARRRYAGGEITKEQYDEIMRALGG